MNSLTSMHKNFISIKDYCIKIIEVVSNTDEEEDSEDDRIETVYKFYQRNRDYIKKFKPK